MRYIKKILKNGLRVIAVPDEGGMAATILVLVETGSKYETKDGKGLSHFIEHMCFKGTKKRPKALVISSELDSMGAQYNAFTGHEYTGYYTKVQPEQFDHALDIVSDIYLNSTFDEKEIEKEKGVIIEEINMYEDLPQRKVQDVIMSALYGDQPAGWSIAGEKETVSKFTRQDFLKYRDVHYLPSSSVVVVAGNINPDTVFSKIEKHFEKMKDGKKGEKLKTNDEQNTPKLLVQKKKSEQTHLVLAVRGFPAGDKRNHVLDVIAWVLGGGMSSRLFQRIREEMGAAYYIRSGNDSFTDHGFLQVSSGVNHALTEKVIKVILEELVKIKKKLVSKEELQMVKDSMAGNIFLGLETSDAVAVYFGEQEMVKHEIKTPEELTAAIKAVSAEDIKKVANELFTKEHLNLALIGPIENEDNFAKLLNI